MMSRSRLLFLVSTVSLSCLSMTPVQAQDAAPAPAGQTSPTANGDIVVTAQRREQNLEKTPVAISAFTGAMMQERAMVRVENIAASTPGLLITPVSASPNAITISMRGALEQNGGTITSESPVALYIDDVYQSRLSAANYDLADIVRVEVLRGPQGTLYGRNSMTGAIKLITRQPDGKTWLNTDISYGSYQESRAKVSIGSPIASHLAVAASGFYDDRNEGWQYDEVLDKKVGRYRKYGGQVALGIIDVPNLEAVITGRYGASLTDGLYYVPLDLATGKSASNSFYDTRSPRDAIGDTRQKSLSAKIGYDLGGVTLRSITAYEHLNDIWALDFSGGYLSPFTNTTIPGFFRSSAGTQHQFTEELQALGKGFDNKLNWIVGAFYYNEHAQQSFLNDDLEAFGLSYLPSTFATRSKSLAFYAQADYKLLDNLTFSAGIRHSHDSKYFDGTSPNAPGPNALLLPSDTKTKASVWTPRFNLQYDISSDAMVYGTVAKGYRAGGFNSLVIADPANFGSPYKPEKVWSYEGGIKLQGFNRKGHINIAGYYEQLSDLQTLADIGGGSFIAQNAAAAKVWGVEIETGINPIAGVSLYASGTYTGDKYGKLDPASEAAQDGATRLPLLSRWQAQVGGNYELGLHQHGSLVFAGDYNYRSSYYNQVSLDPLSKNKAIGRANASITYKTDGDHLEFYAQARNVTNSKDYYTGFQFIPGVFGYRAPLEPRTWVAGFRYKY